jgi:hypothetical protein
VHQLKVETKCDRLTIEKLPLAIYLEIAAHLRQIEGVKTELIEQPTCLESSQPQFDYLQSQIKCLQIEYPVNLDARSQKLLGDILDYYSRRYGSWHQETIN